MKIIVIILTLSLNLFAAEITTVVQPEYYKNIFGFHVKHMGAPFPNLLGVGFSYFVSKYFRLELSYAPGDFSKDDSSHSISTGFHARFFARNISPAFGINWATIINGTNPYFGGHGKNLYFTTSIQWQNEKWFAAIGYNIPLWVGPHGLPSFEVGIFF